MTKDEKADIALLFKTLNDAMIRIELLEEEWRSVLLGMLEVTK